MYLLLTTYKVSPWQTWEIALQIIIALAFLFIVVRMVKATTPKGIKKNREKHRAKRYKRMQERRATPSCPSGTVSV